MKDLLGRMAGTWTAKEVTAQVGGRHVKGSSKVTCEKTAGGWAVSCKVHVDMGPMKIDEADVIGWDANTKSLHVFSVSSDGVAHDHKGTFANDVLALEYANTKEGKPFHEALSFTFKSPKELTWEGRLHAGGPAGVHGRGGLQEVTTAWTRARPGGGDSAGGDVAGP